MPNQLHMVDTEGDRIEFRLSATGNLQEFVNGKLEIAKCRMIMYRRADGLISDDSGDFNLRPYEQEAKAAALRSLVLRTRVPTAVQWLGDIPTAKPDDRLVIIDRDGDAIEFRLCHGSFVLQEFVNGKLEVPNVRMLTYNK